MLETQRIVQVACGDNFTVVLNSNNQLYAFGANDCGQLGFDVCQFFAKPKYCSFICFLKICSVFDDAFLM